MSFDHEKLDVYRMAIQFLKSADEIVQAMPRGRGYLSDQLQRAALSVVLNIAEGAGKYSGADKAAFYTRARGSVTESAAVLDVLFALGIADQSRVKAEKETLARVGQMLTKLIKSRRSQPDPSPSPSPNPSPVFESSTSGHSETGDEPNGS